MSSAAVQPSIQQAAQQQYSHSSPARDHYPQEQSPDPSISPASSRRQPKYTQGDGAPPNTPQSYQQYSPNPSTTMSTPRARGPSSQHATPASRHSSTAQDPSNYSGRSQHSTNIPVRQAQPAASSPYTERQVSSHSSVPYNTPDLGGVEADRTREDAGNTPGGPAPSQRTRAKDTRVFSEPASSHYRDVNAQPQQSRQQPTQSRSATALNQPPMGSDLPRENSAVINRLVIADPQEDLEREQARVAEARPVPVGTDPGSAQGLGLVGNGGVDDGGRGAQQQQQQQRSRQEHLKTAQPRRDTRFGDYILGQTIGEGEFGKVKLGWKKEGGVQVAIKLIRREVLGNNPNRLPKIYREIAILRGLQHPNIVRLHEMVETERHIGIILEYASGGELFDYILNHRYLKDNAARRLFAQLVSGVGYLHKNGIVHRDLKLENLLLDRNRNIIITDFGFANTFNPGDELGEEIEYNLSNKDYVQRKNLEQIQNDGHRRGDLMQTSCGSPCYAAPELVVSDSLYTGRKVDVWSCGVILYAMLSGYLPFDDDPANPEGDNINLLYKYIVSTPLTFPEYVTPHARDLLRRILVPDPRKRADLFEVARHSWLSEYVHVVSFIKSTATPNLADPQAALQSEDAFDAPGPARASSVREPVKPQSVVAGGLGRTGGVPVDPEDKPRRERDAKRRTVQLEYVAPHTSTARVSPIDGPAYQQSPPPTTSQTQQRARADSVGRPMDPASMTEQVPPVPAKTQQRQSAQASMPPPSRPAREAPRSISDSSALIGSPASSTARPSTRGSITGTSRLPSRGNSYGQPVAAEVAPTNVEGRFAQPAKSGYIISGPLSPSVPGGRDPAAGRPMSQQLPADYQNRPWTAQERPSRHKRTSTMESLTGKLFGRSNSTRRQSQQQQQQQQQEGTPGRTKKDRAYPPVSMKNNIQVESEGMPRPSTDSRRSSFGFGRKDSDEPSKRSSRRFSFLPNAFSRMSLSGASTKDEFPSENKRASMQPPPRSRHDSKAPSGMAFGQGRSSSPSEDTSGSGTPTVQESNPDRPQRKPVPQGPQRGATAPNLNNYPPQQPQYTNYATTPSQQQDRFYSPSQSQETQESEQSSRPQQYTNQSTYPPGFNDYDAQPRPASQRQQQGGNNLQKNNRRFGDAYEGNGSGGSSGGARRVMDWFRKRGRDRAT